MPYNQEQNWLFIHIPKTAGGSITKALARGTKSKEPARPRENRLKMGAHLFLRKSIKLVGRGDLSLLHGAYPYTLSLEHLTYRAIQLLQLIPPASLEAAFKFAVVRNPWQRAVSSFYSHNRSAEYKDFEDFCLRWFDNHDGTSHDELAHRRPQYDFVINLDGGNAMDFILRYETLAHDYSELLKRLELPEIPLPHVHRKAGSKAKDYQPLYTPRAKQKVAQLFESDIDYFKYTF